MRVLTALALLSVLAVPAGAEPVTYHWTGTVTSVTDGSNGTYDLTGTFSNGQAVVFDLTVERTTNRTEYPHSTRYENPITDLYSTIGTYVFSGTNPSSNISVVNDNPDGEYLIDDFSGIATTLVGDPVGTANLSDANFDLYD